MHTTALVVFRQLIVLLALTQGTALAQKPQLDPDQLFDPTHLVTIQIELPKADWDELRSQTRLLAESLRKKPSANPYRYFKGTVTVDGVHIEGVGIRKKGFIGSQDSDRPSLKVKFHKFKDQSLVKGLDSLTLNNNKQDRSLLSQFLSYKLFREAGVPASRCNHAKVTVNGTLLGIYSNVESIKAPFLQRRFGDSSGYLYEGTVADLFPDTLVKFELKTEQTTLQPLTRLAAAMARDELDLEELGKLLDIDAFLKFWATESLISFWDGYTNNQNNYFIYRNPSSSKLYFIPWGVDAAFESRMPIPPYVIRTKSVHSQALLANRLYRLPAIKKKYRKMLEELLGTVWNEDRLLAQVDRVEALVQDHLHKSQRDFPRALRKLRSFIKRRRRVLQRRLDQWPIEFKSGPRRPFYFKQAGSATASFSTAWNKDSPDEPLTNGEATMDLKLEGERVEFKQIGVSAELSKWPTPDGSPQPPTIVFTGTRKSGGLRLTLAFSIAPADFRPTNGKSVSVQGVVIEGRFGFLNPRAWKMMSGRVTFETAEMKPGAAVRGKVKLEIVKMAGGKPTRLTPK